MDNHEKENALNIVTDERTYQVFAESPEDARYTLLTILYLCFFHNWAKLLSLTLNSFFCSLSLSGWFTVLSRVHIATPEQLLEMSHEQANPKNAVVSVLTFHALSLLKVP